MNQFDRKQFQKQIDQRRKADALDVFFLERNESGARLHRIPVEDIEKYFGEFDSMSLSVPMYRNVSKPL